MKKKLLVFLALCVLSPGIYADYKLTGFATAGGVISDSSIKYDNDITRSMNYQHDSKVGINIGAEVYDDWRVSMQFLNNFDKVTGDNRTRIDWAYITYAPLKLNGFKFNMGRKKFDVWLISDYYDIGLLYPWARPPIAIYDLSIFDTIDGPSAYYTYSSGFGEFTLGAYYGQTKYEVTSPIWRTFAVTNQTLINVINSRATLGYLDAAPALSYGTSVGSSKVFGANLAYNNEFLTLRASWNKAPESTLTYTSALTGAEYDVIHKYEFLSLGTKIEAFNGFLISEYANVDFQDISSPGNDGETNTDAYYATLGYNIGLFTPTFTYTNSTTKLTRRSLPGNIGAYIHQAYNIKQSTYNTGLVIKTTDKSNIKLEWEYVDPKEGRGNFLHTSLAPSANVYSCNFNLIF